ncbi:MAG: cellulose biosynthesis protein BcsS [Hyphomicrobiaceae bacterium]|nr:cellulose biosynthesis protein BcsS [Hyphomicrobiaceae bacterium]
MSPTQQVWLGGDVATRYWSTYAGMTIAPYGSLHMPGWRWRAVGGYGEYRYDGVRRLGSTPSLQRFRGRHGFAELLAGYQWRAGNWTLKAFGGAAISGHLVSPLDTDNSVSGTHIGAAVAVESWLELSRASWLSMSARWSSMFQGYKADARLGFRLSPQLDFGLETAISGDRSYDAARAGAFVQSRWGAWETRLSGGVTGDRDGDTSGYATLNLMITY